MSDLLSKNPAACSWVAETIRQRSTGVFGKFVPAVIWSDATDDVGALVVPVDPTALVTGINTDPIILLHSHDPGKPKGQVLETALFETEQGNRFVVAVIGYYSGGNALTFLEIGFDVKSSVAAPASLPDLPDTAWIEIAADSRELDDEWISEVVSDAPLRIARTEVSHNAIESEQELIRIGLAYLALVWNPFVTSIATEAGKHTYAAIGGWIRKLLAKLADRRNPVLDIQAHQNGCQVSFLLRGKDVQRLYTAHEALPSAAAQAAQLVENLKARGNPGRQLIYEFDNEALKWYPSFAILDDHQIITDNKDLISIEQLPTGLSLGLGRNKSLFPQDGSASDDEDRLGQ